MGDKITENSILPYSEIVEPEKIARMLDDNSASYKFYWFLAIINKCIEEPNTLIFNIDDLFMDMLYYSYYSVNECHLYLGVGDILERKSKYIYETYHIKTIIRKQQFFTELKNINKYDEIKDEIFGVLKANVIFRLLKPFYSGEKHLLDGDPNYKKINDLVEIYNLDIPYRFVNNNKEIELNDYYALYFLKHIQILQNFIMYKLSEYLQKKNPSVPGIVNKIMVQFERESLQRQRDLYKKIYEGPFDDKININIYTGNEIKKDILSGDFELDHFIPYSFCNNNEWWNLTPTTRDVNNTGNKGNKIPSMEKYFHKLAVQQYYLCKEIQHKPVLMDEFVNNKNNSLKFVDDRTMTELYLDTNVKEEKFVETLQELIKTMHDIALRQSYEVWEG